MTLLTSIFLGFIQGVAEFLPISSSGHLSIFQSFMGLTDVEHDHMFFDVLLHLGTLIAVFAAYWPEIVNMVKEFFAMLRSFGRNAGPGTGAVPPARRMILLIIVATLPLFAVLPIKDKVDGLYSNTIFIGCALIFNGFLLWFSDRVKRGKKTDKNATVLDALLVGCCQAVAVVPGLSRSGSTITGGLLRGFDRTFAVRFSFILSIPAVLGANILSIADAITAGINVSLLPIYLAGVLSAMVFGYLSIRLLKFIASKGSFSGFSYYCWVVGVVTLILSAIS